MTLSNNTPPTRAEGVLIRTDSAGCTHEFLDWITGQRLSYSVGFTLPDDFTQALPRIPKKAWTPAIDGDGRVRDGADVTALVNLSKWPAGMRVIIRKERPHPGAQLRLTDIDGMRVTAFATNTARGQLADLELRHRRRARAEDRTRAAKGTGLRNLPLHDFTQNQIWCAIVALACELTTWMQLLAFTDPDGTTHQARRWEPKGSALDSRHADPLQPKHPDLRSPTRAYQSDRASPTTRSRPTSRPSHRCPPRSTQARRAPHPAT